MSRYFAWLHRVFVAGAFLLFFFSPFSTASAATCSITTATVVNQAYVTANSCTAIEINGNVSTTWIGTVDLGGGTVTVKSGYTMTMGSSSQMLLGANDDFVVESNATTTHLVEDTNGVQISARNATIQGVLSADGRGCGGGVANTSGRGPSWSTNECIFRGRGAGTGGSSLDGGGGATHGGIGGSAGSGVATTTAYGNSLDPELLGAGGGGGYGGVAGAGGGYISLSISGTLTVNGRISVNGGTVNYAGAWTGSGGGAGGSIKVAAGTLAGSGSMSANGGGGTGGVGGGGGRVRIRYGSLSGFALSSASASAGTNTAGSSASAGSGLAIDRVVDDGEGSLTIFSGFDFPTAGDYTRGSIAILSGSRLTCSAATTTSLTISSSAWLSLSSVSWSCAAGYTSVSISSSAGISTTSTSISFSSATSVTISAPVWTNVTTTLSTTQAGARTDVLVDSALVLRGFVYNGPSHAGYSSLSGGFLSIHNAIPLSLVSSTIYSSVSSTVLTSLSIDSLSRIAADGRGCAGGVGNFGSGSGPSWSTDICIIGGRGVATLGSGLGGGAGGTHGGAGGSYSPAIATSTTYGSSTLPSLFGAGGGGGYGATAVGGAGGGIVNITVSGDFLFDGIISANGASGTYGGAWGGAAGGSGGSVNIRAATINGVGYMYARGGGGAPTSGSAGGGGRVAVRYSSLGTFSLSNLDVIGGVKTGSGNNGSAGTTYTLQVNQLPNVPGSLGSITLTNGSTTGTVTPIFTFTLSDSDVADTVKFQIQIDNSADFGSLVIDYTSALAAQGSTSFQVGQSAGSGTYAAGSSGQSLTDGSYYWRVKTIDANAAESSYTTANSGAVAFIVDSATRSISFQLSSGSDAESVTATSIRITLDTTHFEDVTVNYAVSSTLTTASGSGVDYTLASGTATIEAGQTSTTVSLAVAEDVIDEPNEVVGIELSGPTFASLGVTNSYVYTISDDDTAGVTASQPTRSVTEGSSSQTLTYVLDTAPTSTVLLTFTTSTAGITVAPMTISFTTDNWSTPQTLTILATDDSIYESTHTTSVLFTVSGSVYGYPDVSPPSVVVTITDNETSDITLSRSTLAITEGGTSSFTMVLAAQPTSTVTITPSGESRITFSPSSLVFTAENWSAPQMFTVGVTDNAVYSVSDLTSNVSLGIDSLSNFASVVLPTVAITITENDAVPGSGALGAAFIPLPPVVSLQIVVPMPPLITPQVPPPTSSPSDVPAPLVETIAPRILQQVSADTRSFNIKAKEEDQRALAAFIQEGASPSTRALGEGERRALVRDALETLRRANIPLADLERMAQGVVPQARSLSEERKQVSRALPTFQTIFGRAPNFKNPQENLAWNTLLYRIRFPRDMTAERRGITEFKRLFGRNPTDPFQWAVVRVLGYIQR